MEIIMTSERIKLVQDSFRKVVPNKDTAAQLFYVRLFELDPDLKAMFRGDMSEQGRKLMVAIATVVNGLDNLGDILPVVRDLGRRHVGYGVKQKDYETVGAALLWTLKQGLGDDFTEETKQAWSAAYGLLSSTMIEAGYAEAA